LRVAIVDHPIRRGLFRRFSGMTRRKGIIGSETS